MDNTVFLQLCAKYLSGLAHGCWITRKDRKNSYGTGSMSAINLLPQPVFQLIGIAGFIFYMLSYGLLQLGKISGQGYVYVLLNMAAASLVLISLVEQFNLASVLIQLAWIAISIIGLLRIRFATHTMHDSARRVAGPGIYRPEDLPASSLKATGSGAEIHRVRPGFTQQSKFRVTNAGFHDSNLNSYRDNFGPRRFMY